MANFLVQLYGDIDDLCNSRILQELDYYMYEVKSKDEMIFYFTREQTVFIVIPSGSSWSIEKIQVLIRTALRENTFILLPMDSYTGYMKKDVWDSLKDESKKFFDNPTTYRVAAGRGNKLSKLLCRIKRAVKPKEK